VEWVVIDPEAFTGIVVTLRRKHLYWFMFFLWAYEKYKEH
jgi:hypothetical protein